MYKTDVIAYFGGNQTKVAQAIGRTKSAVSQWKRIVPLECAIKLQAVTHGDLSLDMSVYKLPALRDREKARLPQGRSC